MSIETTESRVSYAGDGVSTANPVSFPFQEQADLVVSLFEVATGAVTPQTLATHYTISGTVDPDFGYINGGVVNMITPVPTGTNLVIYRDPEVIQSLSIPTSGQLPSKPIERQLDLTTMVVQRVNDVITRSVTLPDGFGDTFDPALPSTIALSAGAALVVNSAGDGFEMGPDTTQIAAAAAAAASASTYAWYGSAGGTANALTLTPSTALTAYAEGIRIAFKATATNTTAATMNISGLGVKTLKSQKGAALVAGDITSGRIYTITYDGTDFFLAERNIILPTEGGTNLTGYTTGDMLYASGTDVLTKRAIGTSGQVLTVSGGVPTWSTPTMSLSQHEIHLTTGNGHGSSGTCVRRFSTTVTNTGSAMTYADSATNGMSVTVNTTGLYYMSYSDMRTTNTPEVNITKNASALNVSPFTLTNGTVLATAFAPTNTWAQCSALAYLTAGDIIRAQNNGSNDDTTIRVIFRMIKIG